MSTPFFGFYPLFRPKRLVILSYYGAINSGDYLRVYGLNGGSPVSITVPDYGRLIILVSTSEAGYFGYNIGSLGNFYNGTGISLVNGGNTLSANVWYKFEIPTSSNYSLQFYWQSSSSSVSWTYIQLVVIWEPTETPPSAGATD